LTLINAAPFDLDLSTQRNIGFFQLARHAMYAPGFGYATPAGKLPFIAFDGGDVGFAFRVPDAKFEFFLEVSGFVFGLARGWTPHPPRALRRGHLRLRRVHRRRPRHRRRARRRPPH